MKKVINFMAAVVLFFCVFPLGKVHGENRMPNDQWAKEHGWTKHVDSYKKTVDGVCYELWCGKNAYDKAIGNDFSWQIVVLGVEQSSETIAILNEVDGYPVKSIGSDAFRGNADITEVKILSGVECIGAAAFENCDNLEKITLSSGLKMIEAEAFYNCPMLRSLTIPTTVEYVGRTAFCGETFSGPGLEELVFKGNAPKIIYTGQQAETGLAGISDVTVKIYANTSGWDGPEWEKLNLEKQDEYETTPTPEETTAPEVTVTPETTPFPEVTVTPETTPFPEATVTPETTPFPEVTVTPETIPFPEITPTPEEQVEVFKDVYSDWYTEDVYYAYQQGWMKGYGNKKMFQPMKMITKAQVVQVLYNMEKCPEVLGEYQACKKLKDVYPNQWYTDAVCWAYDHGIITGDLNTKKFYPDNVASREQLVLMLYRYAKWKGVSLVYDTNLQGMEGANKISSWSADAVEWAVATGILQGIQNHDCAEMDGHVDLAPQKGASRAQMAVMIKRFSNIMEEQMN